MGFPGVEPGTYRLKGECSTIELKAHRVMDVALPTELLTRTVLAFTYSCGLDDILLDDLGRSPIVSHVEQKRLCFVQPRKLVAEMLSHSDMREASQSGFA